MSKEIDAMIERMQNDYIKFVRLQFVDINGVPKSIALPCKPEDMEGLFNDGLLFDGSSIDGFAGIESSDLLLKPDINTYSPLSWRPEESATCRFICDVCTSEGHPYPGDPRSLLKNTLANLEKQGYTYNIGPEPEFYILDQDTLGYPVPIDNASNFDVDPSDKGTDFRRELSLNLEELNFKIESNHHEVGPGQNEISFKFDDALLTADAVITFKQAIKAIVDNIAQFSNNNYRVTFMPKPFNGVEGSGMHCHQSLFKKGKNAFADPDAEYGLSDTAMYFIGGLLKHAFPLTAITNPTVNSYKRLVPGYEAPVHISYGLKNRSALIRVPATSDQSTRIEYRVPDPVCNPYLAFTAMLVAGMDGVKNKIEPGEPCDVNLYELSEAELEKEGIKPLPASLWEAYHSLENSELLMNALGPHIGPKFLELKYAEWDDYRVQVFNYEQRKYLEV